ncbi:hypothetical protein PLANTIT3_80089 [Plantibacter sp. T3]|nr:hypothetical protein PLANTIT3_80089 [Plantibacter sp. T3]
MNVELATSAAFSVAMSCMTAKSPPDSK